MKISYINLFATFFRIGLQLLGGGYIILPLLKKEFIEKNELISEEELLNFYAISQCIPGLIAINVSIFIGSKIKGKLGSIAALAGMVMPSFIIILLLANMLISQLNNPIIQSIFWGVRISVIALIFYNVVELWKAGIKNIFSFILFLTILIVMLTCKISPAILVIFAAISGILYVKYISRKYEVKQ